ncbi:light-harvesting protein [Roseicyclus persicicus]|uniref:Light-harvesting protein n=1 Tax=Roseicyclus persicicus TaxID=2650661 RepID=A0A7X6K0T6_9RHOB|nr:light-harvesting protein [Roseibacterium persicicum]NKX46213.1 light-harvesting protein [Roseibacterium persicicum]
MNNAKMWLVVKPTVGVPLFLGAVAVTSLAVHLSVIGAGVGSWYGPYVTGGGAEGSASLQTEQPVLPASADAAGALPTYIEANADGTQSLRVILPDGRTATLVVDDLTQAALRQ